jgi:hypothetical protein
MGQNRVFGQFQYRDGVLSTHGWKVFEEIVEGIAFLQVVKERLDWDPRAGKHDCAAHHCIGPRNQGLRDRHLCLGWKYPQYSENLSNVSSVRLMVFLIHAGQAERFAGFAGQPRSPSTQAATSTVA